MKPNSPSIIAPFFSSQVQKLVDSFEGAEIYGKPKGASHTARIINEVFCVITEEHNSDSPTDLAYQLHEAAKYFINTRGQMTPTITNAINLVLDGLDQHLSSVSDISTFVLDRCEKFNLGSLENLKSIQRHGASLLESGMNVFVYDYSSTVAGILTYAGNQSKSIQLIIPESRALNGGIPLVKSAISSGHKVLYITDAAAGQQLSSAKAVFIGAESITNQGGCWNTTGSITVALLANHYSIPLYVPTELMKYDTINPPGQIRTPIWKDIPAIKSNDPVLLDKNVSVQAHDLDHIKAELITAFVTEKGILSPSQTVSAAQGIFR